MSTPHVVPSAADLDAARLLLARLGVSLADLVVAQERAPVPTFAEYLPVVRAAVAEGTRRVYGSYWNRIVEHWGTRRLDAPTPSEVNELAEYVKNNVVTRRNAVAGAAPLNI
jgi:integrase/recombinase XerC